ncbi:hypothetical protein ACLQ3K_16130 [Tsukamurella sp. DT100]|uniref:hypothetical protein n=1 Tax=Tsukamurella sp. DT100 TaxID=3393415 RepID=UPI003CF972CC
MTSPTTEKRTDPRDVLVNAVVDFLAALDPETFAALVSSARGTAKPGEPEPEQQPTDYPTTWK